MGVSPIVTGRSAGVWRGVSDRGFGGVPHRARGFGGVPIATGQVPVVVVPDDDALPPGQVDVIDRKHMLVMVSQQ
jgi:hypothetical protein